MEPDGPIKAPPKRLAAAALARQLLAVDGVAGQESETVCAAAEDSYRRLRTRLVVSLGSLGFDALWTRALQLTLHQAAGKDSALVTVALAGGPPGLRAFVRDDDPVATHDLLVAVLASFFTLLVTFIGEQLTLRILSQLWPSIPTDEREPAPEGKDDDHAGV